MSRPGNFRRQSAANGPLVFRSLDRLAGGLGNGNHVASVLLDDHRTVWQDLPLTHCIGGNWTCSGTDSTRGDLYAGGQIGAHGGTGMSGLGGSLRLGELVKGGAPIRHALAVAPNCPVNCMACPETPGAAQFRWPAITVRGALCRQRAAARTGCVYAEWSCAEEGLLCDRACRARAVSTTRERLRSWCMEHCWHCLQAWISLHLSSKRSQDE